MNFLITCKDITISGLSADICAPANTDFSKAVIIGVHGLLAFKDTIFWPTISRWFARQGFTFLKFNFSHNGIGPDLYNITEFDKLKNNSLSLEYSELDTVVKFAANLFAPQPIYILGHSLGGFISINYAADNAPSIRKVASWAAPLSLKARLEEETVRRNKDGSFVIYSEVYNREIEISAKFLEELNSPKFDILKNIARLKMPLLILHSQEDETVPFSESKTLYTHATKENTEYVTLAHGGHSFMKPDGKIDIKNLETAFNATLNFFNKGIKIG